MTRTARRSHRGSGKAGYICVRNPWPGRMLTVWGQDQRFIDTYYARFNKDKDSKDWRDWPFMCGDGAVESADGYFRILGRIDDVINVAGHRLGTKELESAAITVDEVAEAAAVPVIDEIRGKIVEMYVAVKPGVDPIRGRQEGLRRDRQGDRRDRPPEERVDRQGHAEDPLGEDHATRDRRRLELRRGGRREHAGQPRDRRRHPPPRAEREGGQGRGPARAVRGREGWRSPRTDTRSSRCPDCSGALLGPRAGRRIRAVRMPTGASRAIARRRFSSARVG